MIDLERAKRELENAIARKEKDLAGAQNKLDDEQNQVRGIKSFILKMMTSIVN